jgi:two-component system NtrC family sensor kinase
MTDAAAKEFLSEVELESRIEALRKSAPDSIELVHAILECVATLWFRPPVAGPLVEEAIEISDLIGYELGRARALVPKAFLMFIQTKYDECIPILSEALPLITQHNETNEWGRAMLLLSATSQVSGDYDQALEYGFKLIGAEAEFKDEELVAWMHYRVADVYRELGDSERMLHHAQTCHESFEDLYTRSRRLQHRVGSGRARTQLAAAYQKNGQLDEALSYNRVALGQYREVGDRLGETRALTDIGRLLVMLGDEDEGERHLKEALQIRREMDHRTTQPSNLLALGKLYLARGDTDQALEVLDEALAIADEAHLKMRAYEIHETLSRAYKEAGDLETALRHHELFHAQKEEVAGETMSLKIHNRKVLAEINRAEREAEFERSRGDELARLLDELRSTQDRLIQSEKMASLGQLTAGIAHEIRNPLNFVNNFSALSADVVADMVEALEKCGDRLDENLRTELEESLGTLVFNTTRIKEHGARADRIVANMIDHSRGGNRERSVVNLNEMVEEYVILAYHALTAREDKFLVFIDRNYDPTIGEGQLVSQEIGRVLMNLIGNAVDALAEEGGVSGEEGGRRSAEGGVPMVTISTSKYGPTFEIRVTDNGPGIPESVRDKIFEPFFTTKPTGSGTGLGLSMSYDIVTKGHGGEMKVVSKPGKGATFIVRLPV